MFETTELCRNVGFRDADNHRYLAVAMIIEVEKQKGAIERWQGSDHPLQERDALVRFCPVSRLIRRLQLAFVKRDSFSGGMSVPAQSGDRDIQGNAIHPSGKGSIE